MLLLMLLSLNATPAQAFECLMFFCLTDVIFVSSSHVFLCFFFFSSFLLFFFSSLQTKDTEYCAPLTSFDWCESDPNLIVTSSIDTTATVWDLETMKSKTQIIAHDKEAYDVEFRPGGNDVFATVGNDGSLRIFDLRDMEHSHIVYETPTAAPLLRLGWNKQDSHYVAAIELEGSKTIIMDCRAPNVPVAVLEGHKDSVANALAWAPHSSCHICTGGDDSRAIIWDLSPLPKKIEDPILAYNATSEINNLMWSSTEPDWVAITCGTKIQILRV